MHSAAAFLAFDGFAQVLWIEQDVFLFSHVFAQSDGEHQQANHVKGACAPPKARADEMIVHSCTRIDHQNERPVSTWIAPAPLSHQLHSG